MKKIVSGFFLCLFLCNCSVSQQNGTDPLQPPIDALPTVTPDRAGMNRDSLVQLIKQIRETTPHDFRGLVVIKDNKLVVEEYFNTYWRESIHDIRSAGKAITALLLGIAIDKGLVKNVDQSIYDFFQGPDYVKPANDAHRDIKIKHLLTMSCGLDSDDDRDDSPGTTGNWLMRKDWVNFAIQLPMIFKPGEQYMYTDICPMLIGAIIEKQSGQKLADFAETNLFKPLGIREYYWYTAPNGKTVPMGNLYISTLDFAKIGSMVVQEGKWDGQQIVSSRWIKEISTQRTDISKVDRFANGYGYFWFITTKKIGSKEYRCFFASGNGGNLLFVVPELNMVVSLTSGSYGQRYGHTRSHNIFESVLRSVQN